MYYWVLTCGCLGWYYFWLLFRNFKALHSPLPVHCSCPMSSQSKRAAVDVCRSHSLVVGTSRKEYNSIYSSLAVHIFRGPETFLQINYSFYFDVWAQFDVNIVSANAREYEMMAKGSRSFHHVRTTFPHTFHPLLCSNAAVFDFPYFIVRLSHFFWHPSLVQHTPCCCRYSNISLVVCIVWYGLNSTGISEIYSVRRT